jgi:ribose transport system ATP-binding protein
MAHNDDSILSIRGVTKRFPGVVALDSVDMEIRRGEVHVLLGENGAGKSSLVKVLCGIHTPEEGELFFEGKPYSPASPQEALAAGIRVVYQEFNLLSNLSIGENIFFEHLPRKNSIVDFSALYEKSRKLLDQVGLDIDPRIPVELLGVAQMQLIEVLKAVAFESKVLILDEPTATLTSKEIDKLFTIIRALQKQGVTIIYISHRLKEIYEIGDRLTVLRNGKHVTTTAVGDITIPEIVRHMVGRSMEAEFPFDESVTVGEVTLSVEGLRYPNGKHRNSFSVRRGEILGIAGLVGSGRTETVRAVFGADRKEEGRISLKGKELDIRSPKDAIQHGICLLTEDRKSQGLILDMPCDTNITITDLSQISRFGLLDRPTEREKATQLVEDLSVRTPSVAQLVRNLSGGNQQKVVIAKWLYRQAEVLIFDEPTRGIDVGAKYEIYLLLWRLAAEGKSVIVVSSELPELLGICHRMLVFSNGKISGELSREEFDQERVLAYAYKEYIESEDLISEATI